jgi:cyclic pyranopterin monophosphate synthase
MGMIDISQKKEIYREAIASGMIHLKESTIELIQMSAIKKGNPIHVAEAAALLAVKQTPLLLPHCHPIPIQNIIFLATIGIDTIKIQLTVASIAKTGVEMEALVGVSIALNTIWDMVKYLEKDENGQYPGTRITDILVEKKIKKE